MMPTWFLLWIIPLSACLGLIVAALCLAAKWGDMNAPTQSYWKDGNKK